MRVFLEDHQGKELTGRRMYQLASIFWPDLGKHLGKSFPQWFDYVRRIPYLNDAEKFKDPAVELVGRPSILLDRSFMPRLDCKKKSILIGAYCEGNRIPWRLIAISELPSRRVHHVFPMVKFGRIWATADPTLPGYRIAQGKSFTHAEELAR